MKTALNKILLIVLLLCLTVLPLTAQTGKFYSTNNELSSSLINQIFQDKRGFIWIATEYGLNRFDGLRFSNYKHVSGDSTSIKNNYVRTLFEDSRQNLLVGCIDGLMKYDSETDTFREIPMIRAGKRVTALWRSPSANAKSSPPPARDFRRAYRPRRSSTAGSR